MHLVKEDEQRRVKFIDYQPEPRAVDGVFLDGTPLEDKSAVTEATRFRSMNAPTDLGN